MKKTLSCAKRKEHDKVFVCHAPHMANIFIIIINS
jgi:hypothetical protein